MSTFLAALILAAWVSAIALISVQNAAPVALQFLFFRSVPLPFGLLLGFCVGLGAVLAAVLVGLGRSPRRID